MLTVSPRFLAAVSESHRVSVAATIIPPGGAPPPAETRLIGGSLRADRDARVRRAGSITVGFDLAADLDYVRELPFGGYVQLERGILYADGTMERPRIATLRVNTVSWSRSQGQATLDLADRMAQVQDEPLIVPYAPTGLLPAAAVHALVYAVFGDTIVYHETAAGGSALVDAVFDQDRAAAVSELAASINAVAYFDADGDFVLAPKPPDEAHTEPVWEFEVGEHGTLLDAQENLDRSAVRNGVAVRGQAAADTAPIYALAVDDDPGSPTRWGGPFGRVALIVSLTAVQSQAQADATAASLLNLRLGLARAVTLRGVPNPALEPDDVVLACFPDGREEALRINSLSLGLDPASAMDAVASGHWTSLSQRRSPRRAIRVLGGAAAWRELEQAELVTA